VNRGVTDAFRPTSSGDAIDRELWSMLDAEAAAVRRFRRDRLVLGAALAGGYVAAAVELLGSGRALAAIALAFYVGPIGGLTMVAVLDRTADRT
jgi:hypothetical protein